MVQKKINLFIINFSGLSSRLGKEDFTSYHGKVEAFSRKRFLDKVCPATV